MAPLTMFDKLWNKHVVYEEEGQPSILYIDLHLVHEVTSPQAFDGLRMAGRGVRRPDLTVCTVDHNTPTWELSKPVTDEISKRQLDALEKNCKEFGLDLYDRFSEFQGIVHVIGPDLGYTQPGKTVVCGDSHTSTHGALGCFAIGIGTSEVEHVLATQTLRQFKPGSMEVRVEGPLPFGVEAKDVILGIIGQIGTNGGTGYVIEYTGEAIESLSMDGRMTVCNMSIEAGARAGMIAPDQKTIEYVRNRKFAPKGEEFEKAAAEWLELRSDPGAKYDKVVVIDASKLEPAVTWGTNPGMVTSISGQVPNPGSFDDVAQQESATRALEYMGLEPETPMSEIKLDRVFLGACTNSRIEDLRAAAKVVKGKKVHDDVYAMVVPGSALIKKQAEDEGLDKIFIDAGLDWRIAGCSMCLGMNPDTLSPGERCASTSNRNFEGRQGKGGRTHLVSPPMAAAAPIAGHVVDVRDWDYID